MVIYDADLFLIKGSYCFEVSHCGSFRKLFDFVGDDGSQSFSFSLYRFLGNDVELSEGNNEKFLEVGNGPDPRIGMVGVSRVAYCGEVAPHKVDEHAVVGDLEQRFSIDLEYGYCQRAPRLGLTETNLEKNFDTHSQNTVDDTESEDERHGVDV